MLLNGGETHCLAHGIDPADDALSYRPLSETSSDSDVNRDVQMTMTPLTLIIELCQRQGTGMNPICSWRRDLHRSLDNHCEAERMQIPRVRFKAQEGRGERQFLGNGMARDEDEGRRLRARCNHRVCEPRHTTYSRPSEHSAPRPNLFRGTRREMTSDARLNEEGEPFLPRLLLLLILRSPLFSSQQQSEDVRVALNPLFR